MDLTNDLGRSFEGGSVSVDASAARVSLTGRSSRYAYTPIQSIHLLCECRVADERVWGWW